LAFVLNNIGTTKTKMKDYPGAMAAFNRAISVDPNFHLAYNNRGIVQMHQKRLDDAIKDFEKALAIQSDYSPAASNISGIYFQKEAYEEAVKYADLAIKLNKQNASAYVNRGMAKEMLRNMNGACEDWFKARELGAELGRKYHSENCGN
jgi:tetratricopeptide (TPR) repeat protein